MATVSPAVATCKDEKNKTPRDVDDPNKRPRTTKAMPGSTERGSDTLMVPLARTNTEYVLMLKSANQRLNSVRALAHCNTRWIEKHVIRIEWFSAAALQSQNEKGRLNGKNLYQSRLQGLFNL
ncbi:hypothetical protein PCANC_12336 [Puccinia coronata f. sp. avenae]|uniref:Uncharacterized protein n=1 Tax=Puccinia coronata f. sp. avenae TaxID=200324 RepID=A0A2N5SBY6_9BASI|nr:hypothetical protein PCANC_21301 [Puccinia coronata f. sp. avenae]PLW44643.1 hypothetical protein PCANC_12336 [Puccinia coronata f. sp. avenae]